MNCAPPADSVKECNRCTRSQSETPRASVVPLEIKEQIKLKAANHQLLARPSSDENIYIYIVFFSGNKNILQKEAVAVSQMGKLRQRGETFVQNHSSWSVTAMRPHGKSVLQPQDATTRPKQFHNMFKLHQKRARQIKPSGFDSTIFFFF